MIAQAEAICKHINGEFASNSKGVSPPEILRVAPHNLALEQQSLDQLKRLRPPASFRPDWKLILDFRRVLINQLRDFIRDAKRNDTSAIKTLVEAKKTAHDLMYENALRVGFKNCASVG